MTTYGLWRAESPLNLAPFESEAEALAAVRAAIAEHGIAFVAGWSLVRIPGRGDWITLAEGPALIDRARAEAPTKDRGGRPARRPTLTT